MNDSLSGKKTSRGSQTTGIVAALLLCLAALPAAAQTERCLNLRCFSDSQIRSFRVLESDTVIIYVGPDYCPFLVTIQDAYCDANFLPEIDFFEERTRRRVANNSVPTNPEIPRRALGGSSFIGNNRICLNRAEQYALETFGFGRVRRQDLPFGAAACPVVSMDRLTDDDLVEFYAAEGMPPPPPLGTGDISRAEEPGDEAE